MYAALTTSAAAAAERGADHVPRAARWVRTCFPCYVRRATCDGTCCVHTCFFVLRPT